MADLKTLLELLEEVDEDIDFENEDNLIEAGIVNSLMLNQIIAEIDDAFDIHIETKDIEPENFENVEAMLNLIDKYQG